MACPNFKNGPEKVLGPLGIKKTFTHNFTYSNL
jgi:hypothetical protein